MLILDSSGMLSVVLGEQRGVPIRSRLVDAMIGAVNLAEVATILNRRGMDADAARAAIAPLNVPVLPASAELAVEAGAIEEHTRRFGLSLGDRFALVLARMLEATLVTSDRRLAEATSIAAVQSWLLVTPGAGSAR